MFSVTQVPHCENETTWIIVFQIFLFLIKKKKFKSQILCSNETLPSSPDRWHRVGLSSCDGRTLAYTLSHSPEEAFGSYICLEHVFENCRSKSVFLKLDVLTNHEALVKMQMLIP